MQTESKSKCGGKRLKGILANDSTNCPLITVVTAVFNASGSLDETIESVLGQTYRNVEYIIIDGGSTDGTLDILRKYEHEIDYWVSEPDKGVYDAFNKSCPYIRGQWTVFLGAGDVFYNTEVLSKISLAACEAHCDTEILYGTVCLTNSNDYDVKILNRPWSQMQNRWRGGRPMLPHHQGIFHRKTLLKAEMPFDTSYKIAADSKLVYASIKKVSPIFCDTIIARASLGGVSTDPKYFMLTAHEILKINYDLGHANYGHQLWFYLKCLFKSFLYKIGGEANSKKLIDKYRIFTGRKAKWAR
jgi:glycosyltransferase involved in cell wall biosynthesis